MPNDLDAKILQAYADAGYTLFPLIGKIPPKGFAWSKAEYNPFPKPADFPSGNFGVKLDSTDLVIDVDPRNFQGRKVLDEISMVVGKMLGSSFVVRTGANGAHIYYRKPADVAIRGALKEFPGIEAKTKGQYVVGPGSVHPDTGNLYTVHFGLLSNILDAPQALLDLIARVGIPAPTQTPMEYISDDQTKSRFLNYLRTAPIAIEGQHGDRTTFAVAAVGHDFGLHPDICLELMAEHYNPKCEPPWAPGELKTKVYNAYRYSGEAAGAKAALGQFPKVLPVKDASFFRSNNGIIQKTVYNTVTAFEVDLPGILSLNVWTEDIVFTKPAPWHDPDEIVPYWDDKESARLKYYLGKERRFEPKNSEIEEALVTVGGFQKFHPIKTALESYVWDGVPRVKDWLVKFMGAEDCIYTRTVGLKTLIGAIKRIYEPGCQFDYIMVLEGAQGIGKSRCIKILGGDYYGDLDLNLHDKDTIECMRRFWIIEASEMEVHRKQESATMRSFLSRQTDVFRVPYARRAKAFPRQSIFIGSINPELCEDIGWLKDTTGNRRYWPIRCGTIDVEGFRKVRDQLWAEALKYYRSGAVPFLEDANIEAQATIEQQKRMGADPWYERVLEWITYGFGKDKKVLTLSQLFCDCLGGKFAMINRVEQRRIADIMRSLKWEKGVFYSDETKGSVRGYKRPGSEK
jgi:predicted P-loop ATPase